MLKTLMIIDSIKQIEKISGKGAVRVMEYNRCDTDVFSIN